MKNPLVPELRTDKNGVTSTRWVKADTGSSITASSLPAPAPVAVKEPLRADPETIERAAMAYVNEVTYDEDEYEYVDSTLATAIDDFGTYPAVVVEEIAMPAGNQHQKMWVLKNMMDTGKPLESIRDHLNLSDHIISEGFEDQADPENALYNFGASYEGLEPIDLETPYPERRRKQLEGVISATSLIMDLASEGKASHDEVNQADDGLITLADERLRDLFIHRTEDSALVLEFMKERKTTDYDRIMEMLESKTPAVASGVL